MTREIAALDRNKNVVRLNATSHSFISRRNSRRGSLNPDTGDWVWSEDEEEDEEEEQNDAENQNDDEDSDEDAVVHIASPEEKARRQQAIEMANQSTSSSDDETEKHSKSSLAKITESKVSEHSEETEKLSQFHLFEQTNRDILNSTNRPTFPPDSHSNPWWVCRAS